MGVGDQGGLDQDTSVLEVAVGDAALRVVRGDQVAFHVWWEGMLPQVGLVVKVCTAHADLRSICGPS